MQRATVWPSRLSWAHTFGAPYTPKFSACTRAISAFSSASRCDRAEAGRRLADQYVDGRTAEPCRSARPRSGRGGRRCRRTSSQAVELGREESRRRLQDLIDPAQLTILALEPLEPSKPHSACCKRDLRRATVTSRPARSASPRKRWKSSQACSSALQRRRWLPDETIERRSSNASRFTRATTGWNR